jgi:hypothetical protein
MSMHRLLNTITAASRDERKKYHVTLGELIDALGGVDADSTVILSGEHSNLSPALPPNSYRGHYEDLAFPPSLTRINAGELRAGLIECEGKAFEGWKGGDFIMGRDTPLWIADSGEATGLAVIDTDERGGDFVLVTKEVE